MGSREEYETLLERSRRFRETASYQIRRGFYDLAAFSLEQALQLYIKALLIKLGVGYPRTHSLRRLLRLIGEADPALSGLVERLLEKYSVELAALEDAYVTSRYVPREFEEGEVKRLERVVREVIESLEGRAGQRGVEEEEGI